MKKILKMHDWVSVGFDQKKFWGSVSQQISQSLMGTRTLPCKKNAKSPVRPFSRETRKCGTRVLVAHKSVETLSCYCKLQVSHLRQLVPWGWYCSTPLQTIVVQSLGGSHLFIFGQSEITIINVIITIPCGLSAKKITRFYREPRVTENQKFPKNLAPFLFIPSFQCTYNTPSSHDSGCLHCAESPPFVPHHRPRPLSLPNSVPMHLQHSFQSWFRLSPLRRKPSFRPSPSPTHLVLFLCQTPFQCACNTLSSRDFGCLHCAEGIFILKNFVWYGSLDICGKHFRRTKTKS